MAKALYSMYNREQSRNFEQNIPLLTIKNEIKSSTDLFLGKTYPNGEIADFIYGDILADNYLVEIDFWDFEDVDKQDVENFFLWLGVNKFSKTVKIEQNDNSDFFSNHIEKPDNNVNWNFEKCDCKKIATFDIINKIENKTKIILLTLKDEQINKKIQNIERDSIKWSYNRNNKSVECQTSYIAYQFIQVEIFTDFLLDDIVNENTFKIDYKTLSNYGYNKNDVDSILLKLGAKENFEDLSSSKIFDLLKKMPKKEEYKEGKGTQIIYKRALDGLLKKTNFVIPDVLRLFAKKGDESGYFLNNEVYYADNSILPKQVLGTYPIFNLPKRAGEDNVAKYFGIKKITDIKIAINQNSIKKSNINYEWTQIFDSLKPYILAYRIEKIKDKSTQKNEARAIKQCQIYIITDGSIQFEDKEQNIGKDEYINERDNFYFKSEAGSVENLKKSFVFCDAFAEIINIVFKINDLQAEFKNLLRDTDYAKHTLEQNFIDNLKIAFELLGIPKIEIDFWKTIFSLKGKEMPETIENQEVLQKIIKQELNFNLPVNYSKVNFETFENMESYELLLSLNDKLKIQLKDILPEQGLLKYHQKKFKNELDTQRANFERHLWAYLNDKEENEQKKYIEKIRAYNSLTEKNAGLIKTYSFELNVEYESEVFNLIKDTFGVDCQTELTENISILKLYEVDESELSEEERSLLYFEGYEERFKKPEVENPAEQKNPENEETNTAIVEILHIKISKANNITNKFSDTHNSEYRLYSSRSDKLKRQNGKYAEQLVYDTFINKYGKDNVQWKSGNSTAPDKNDSCGYDMQYRTNDQENWRYLEVKSVSNNQFFLSQNEKEFAEQNREEYDFALVENGQINIVRFSEITDFDNMAVPNEFIVYYNTTI